MKIYYGFFFCCLTCIFQNSFSQTSTAPAAGDGSSGNPYQISSLDNLNWMAQQVNGGSSFSGQYFAQTQDIDASATSGIGYNSGRGFQPIGGTGHPFAGTYDGSGYSITNVHFFTIDLDCVGTFGYVSGAMFKNMTVTLGSGTPGGNNGNGVVGSTGMLAGSINTSSVVNCHVRPGSDTALTMYDSWDGSFDNRGGLQVGGLIGRSMGSTITGCTVSGITITAIGYGNYDDVGGVAGFCENSIISNCWFRGTVAGFDGYQMIAVGGIVGNKYLGMIDNCYAVGDIQSNEGYGSLLTTSACGGIVGYSIGSINNCYHIGTLSGSALLTGINGGAGSLYNCYHSGSIPDNNGDFIRGTGLAGYGASGSNDFWDVTTTGIGVDGSGTNGGANFYGRTDFGTGKNTTNMKTKSTFTGAGWNFATVWAISPNVNDGYPYLIGPPAYITATTTSTGTAFSPGISVPVMNIAFSSIIGTPWLSSIKIARTGTATDADVPTVQIWTDINKNGIVDDSDAQVGSTANFVNDTATVIGMSYSPSSTTENLLIVFQVAGSANVSHTAGTHIGNGYISGSTGGTLATVADFSTGIQALPVQLTQFLATAAMNTTTLRWSTVTEVNNYGFEVERRAIEPVSQRGKVSPQLLNGSSAPWLKIGFIKGAGSSNTPKAYSFTDANILSGTYAYRLKQIDNDGTYKYSSEAEVTIEVPKVFSLNQNYPNPFNPTTTISFSLAQDGLTTLKIYDILGREIATMVNTNLQAGVLHQEMLNASKLSSGIYFYKLESGKQMQLKKLLLMK